MPTSIGHGLRGRRERLIVFTRYPEPGKTKTRLIPALGVLGAAELQVRLIRSTLAKARQFAGGRGTDLEVCYCGGGREMMRRWLGSGVRLEAQVAGDLGRRMGRAIERAIEDGCQGVVLIGTDVPDFGDEHLRQGFEALENHDMVLGPVRDGGYWLIGMRRAADVFSGMNWGRPDVLKRTVERAEGLGLSCAQLETLADVDRPDDLKLLDGELVPSKPTISVIIPALNEGERIAEAIVSGRGEGVEIIVADGQSSDDTAGVAESLGARVVSCPANRGRQMNLGAGEARGDYLLFLHGDSILPSGYAGGLFRAMLNERVVAGAYMLRSDRCGWFLSMVNRLVELRTKYLQLPYGDQAIFMRRETFVAVGGFTEVAVGEDVLMVLSLRRLGRIAAVDAAVTTSARRWESQGRFRTLLFNQLIVAGLVLAVSPGFLNRHFRR